MTDRVGWQPGTRTHLYITFGQGEEPVEGDLLATPAGASYVIRAARRSPTNPLRFNFDVERLPYGSVRIGDEGVWGFVWHRRRRRG